MPHVPAINMQGAVATAGCRVGFPDRHHIRIFKSEHLIVIRVRQLMEDTPRLDLLMPRERDFATEARFFTLLVQLGIANKELERALPWARVRLRLARDAEAIEAAIKDLMIVLRGEESAKLQAGVLEELQKAATLTIQDRCLLAALLEDSGKSSEAEKTLSDAPEADRLIALSQLAQLWQTRQEWEKASLTLQQVIALPDARTTARVQRIVDFYRRAGKPEEAHRVRHRRAVLSHDLRAEDACGSAECGRNETHQKRSCVFQYSSHHVAAFAISIGPPPAHDPIDDLS